MPEADDVSKVTAPSKAHPVSSSQDKNTSSSSDIKLSDLEDSICIARCPECLHWTPEEWNAYIRNHPKVWGNFMRIRKSIRYEIDGKLPYMNTICAGDRSGLCISRWVRWLYKNHRLTLKKLGTRFPDDMFVGV